MLEGLEDVKWDELGHAYGPASDVPGVIRNLASPDPKIRGKALHQLHGNIWHQGTVYEATAPAVPFLVALLQAPEVEDKHCILAYLALLANGRSYNDVHQHLSMFSEQAKSAEWQNQLEKELSWVKRAGEAVRAGTPIYIRLLEDEGNLVRDGAAYLLGNLSLKAIEALEAVSRRLSAEKDETVKASLVLALGNLADGEAVARRLLLELASSPQAGAAQLAAAMSLLKLDPDGPPKEAIDIVLEAVKNPDKFAALSSSLWAQGETIVSLAAKHLAILQGPATEAAEQSLTQAVGSQPPLQALAVAAALLAMVFPEPIDPGKSVNTLSERQRRVLGVLAENRHLWGVQLGKTFVENVNTSFLMRAYGLPDRFPVFVAFVRGEKPALEPPLTALQNGSMVARVKRLFKK